MRPTVYVPLAEIRRGGLRRSGATMAARFIAGRIAPPRPSSDAERQLGLDGNTNHTRRAPDTRRDAAA